MQDGGSNAAEVRGERSLKSSSPSLELVQAEVFPASITEAVTILSEDYHFFDV